LFDHLQKSFPVLGGYYTTMQIITLLAYMALCRIKTIERLQYESPGELGKLMGLDREGYSPVFFKEMWQSHRIACITYHQFPKLNPDGLVRSLQGKLNRQQCLFAAHTIRLKQSLTDTVKMIAYRAETSMIQIDATTFESVPSCPKRRGRGVDPLFLGTDRMEGASLFAQSRADFFFAMVSRLCHCLGSPIDMTADADRTGSPA